MAGEAGPSKPRSPSAKPANGKKRKRQRIKKKPIQATGVIDMTGDDFEEGEIEPDSGSLVLSGTSAGISSGAATPRQPLLGEAGPSRYSPSQPVEAAAISTFAAYRSLPESLREQIDPEAADAPALDDDIQINVMATLELHDESRSHPSELDVTTAAPQSAQHFQPPAFFDATMEPLPLVRQKGESAGASKQISGSATPAGLTKTAQSAEGLLLPSHITIDDTPAAEADDADGGPTAGDHSMDGVHFIDDDVVKGVTRYFDPSADDANPDSFLANADQSRICQNCKRPGHKAKDCPHIICMTCGQMDDHERRDCPMGLTCFACGQRGHRRADCTHPLSKAAQRSGCDRCGSDMHMTVNCPTIWRVYAYRSAESRDDAIEARSALSGWEKEAAGGYMDEQWCYNCAREGHLGDDCPQRRGSLARMNHASAFSYSQASRGPFARSAARPARSGYDTPRSTHMRWDDDGLSDLTPEFAGSGAGWRGREKEKRQMMDRDRDRDSRWGWDDDDDFWPQYSDSRARNGTRPWESDRRPSPVRRPPPGPPSRQHLPFGHAHLMGREPASVPSKGQQGKGIQFGKLSSLPPRPGPDVTGSPSVSLGKNRPPQGRPGKGMEASSILVDRAIGDHGKARTPSLASPTGSRSGSPANRSRRQNPSAADKDYEAEWRRSGLSGGNVSSWGHELDREERANRADSRREAAGPVQRYHGGYD